MSGNRITAIALVALVLGLVAAGCGSVSPNTVAEPAAKPVTRADWARQVNTICRRENAELEALSEDVADQVAKMGIEKFSRRVLATQERALASVREVPVPPGDRAAVAELTELQAQANEEAERAIDELVAGRERQGFNLLGSADRSASQSVQMAADLGADACADGLVQEVAQDDSSEHLLADDFSDPTTSLWSPGDARGTTVGERDGAYRISVNRPNSGAASAAILPVSAAGISVASDVRQLTSTQAPEVAVVSCIVGSGRGVSYDFAVNADIGYYAITKVSEDGAHMLEQGRRPGVIRGLGRLNRVRGECSSRGHGRATTVRLFVNGKPLLSIRDENGFGNFAGVGLFVYSKAGGTTAEFDNVVVDEL